jgi:iron-sulfur cluster insertion protein
MTVSITANAAAKIAALSNEHKKMVRLAIESGGCNGFNKVWHFDENINSDDTIFACNTGNLIIDSISLEMLGNAIIDYKDDLSGAYFTVAVPAAKSACGCGTSFSI